MLSALLMFFAVIIVPINAGARLFLERKPHDVERFYASPLTAGRIIRGKLASASYETLLLFSMCAPFLFMTTLLRGVDVASVAGVLILGYVLVMAAVQVAFFVGCITLHHAIKGVIAAIAAVVTGLALMSVYMHCSHVILRRGVLGFFDSLTSGSGIGVGGIFVTLCCVLHGMSIAIIANAGGQLDLDEERMRTSPQVPNPQNHF